MGLRVHNNWDFVLSRSNADGVTELKSQMLQTKDSWCTYILKKEKQKLKSYNLIVQC